MIKIDQWSDEQVTHFARDTLGCNCPDEVFEQIERSTPTSGCHALLIGRRLLIHLYECDAPPTDSELNAMLERGKQERDRNRYNRFRLVMIGSFEPETQQRLNKGVDEYRCEDDKLHLHLLTEHPK